MSINLCLLQHYHEIFFSSLFSPEGVNCQIIIPSFFFFTSGQHLTDFNKHKKHYTKEMLANLQKYDVIRM